MKLFSKPWIRRKKTNSNPLLLKRIWLQTDFGCVPSSYKPPKLTANRRLIVIKPVSLKSCPWYHLDPRPTLALKVILHPGPKCFSPPLPGWIFSRGCNSSGNHCCRRGKPWVKICINISISRSNSLTKHSVNSSMEQVETMFHSLNGWVKLCQFEIEKLQQRMVAFHQVPTSACGLHSTMPKANNCLFEPRWTSHTPGSCTKYPDCTVWKIFKAGFH